MPFVNRVTKILGIEHPIIQGGMHYVGYAGLAAAVSEAGGLGTITALTQPTPEHLRQEIRKARELTKKPIAVNLTLLPALAPPDYGAYCDVIISEQIKIVETAGRSPDKWIKKFKENNITVIHKCVAIKHALSAQKMGADIISMDGFECGGHPGESDVGNWVLLPIAARKLSIPFVVSGGCSDGKQLAAAFALGAEGMNMGTRFMATKEAPIHDGIKAALVKGDENSTMLIMRSVKNTERVFKNDMAVKVAEIEKKDPGNFNAIGPYVKGMLYKKSFQETGNPTDSVWSAGQSIGLIDSIPSCKELVDSIVDEAESIIGKKLPQMMTPRSKL